ncbi:MAG: porin family protein [Halioglobus sp.]
MKKQLMTATAAACLALAGAAQTASAEIPVTINAGYGYWFFDRDVNGFDVDDTGTPVVGLEWAFNDNWAAEILFADDETDLDGGPDADVTTWQVGVLYYAGSYIGDGMRLRPYAAFGAGEIDIDADTFDTVETTVNGGLGVRWMLGKRVGVRLEARALYSLDESETDILTTAGLNIYLGKVDADPVVQEVLDSDGDGVPDDRDRCPGTAPGTRVDADGCPLPVAKVASVKLKVNFDFDSTRKSSTSRISANWPTS